MKVKIPVGKDGFMLVLTKNLIPEDFEKVKKILEAIDWDVIRFAVFPSEFIHKIKYVKRKLRRQK